MEARAWREFLRSIRPAGVSAEGLAMELASAGLALAGKSCSYRPIYHAEMKTATIVSCRELASLSGKVCMLALLDNGDEVDVMSVYFPLSPCRTQEQE